MYFRDSNLPCYLLCYTVIITRQHYQPVHTGIFQCLHGSRRIRLNHI